MASSPITCHVLDTLSGLPASNLNVVLTLLTPRGLSLEELPPSGVLLFHAATNEDGRVREWIPNTKFSVQDLLDKFDHGDESVWSLKFGSGNWYREKKIECFFPEIEVKFFVKKGTRHYHVPVLVGPWTYTTYRGS
jgi:5-hydroxyisourate hydrolase